MPYAYTNGDGLAVLIATEPVGASEPVSNLDDAIRQVKAYLKDTLVGPHALISALFPVGVIMEWPATAAPTDWLICDGAAISRTTYATLFALISTTYGAGNGTTTFNIPDLRRKFVLGKDGALSLGATGGEEEHVLLEAELPSYTKKVGEIENDNADGGAGRTWVVPTGTGDAGDHNVALGGSDDPHNNMPPYIVLNKIIKVL